MMTAANSLADKEGGRGRDEGGGVKGEYGEVMMISAANSRARKRMEEGEGEGLVWKNLSRVVSEY